MLAWSTVIPLKPTSSLDKIYSIFRVWLEGSPHSRFRTEHVLPDTVVNGISTLTLGREKVDACRLDDDALGLRYCKNDGDQTWRTELVFRKQEKIIAAVIRIYVDVPGVSYSKPRAKTPVIVQLLIRGCGCLNDGIFPCSTQMTKLQASDAQAIADLISGRTSPLLPVLYVTPSYEWTRENVLAIEKWVGGRAHLVMAPSDIFACRVARLSGVAPYPSGSITVFIPGAKHPITLPPYQFPSFSRMMAKATVLVRDAMLNATGALKLDFASLETLYNRRIYENNKHALDSRNKEYNEFTDYADDVISSQEKQIKELNATIDHLRGEVARLNAKACKDISIPIQLGAIEPYYPEELKDAVLTTLKLGVKNLCDNGRFKTIINDILTNNPHSDFEQRVEKALCELLIDAKDIRRSDFTPLEKLGFVYEAGNKHHQVSFHGDQQLMWTVSKTPSDHRSGKNAVSDFLKRLFK